MRMEEGVTKASTTVLQCPCKSCDDDDDDDDDDGGCGEKEISSNNGIMTWERKRDIIFLCSIDDTVDVFFGKDDTTFDMVIFFF